VGFMAFMNFLRIYRDNKHPEHRNVMDWAKSQYFREYDPDFINNILKGIKYKKTEWDKINHVQYKIIENRYRKE